MRADFFGLGMPEVLVLAMGLLCAVAAVVVVVGVLWMTLRKPRGGDEPALRREIARLQAEVDRLTNKAKVHSPDTGITRGD